MEKTGSENKSHGLSIGVGQVRSITPLRLFPTTFPVLLPVWNPALGVASGRSMTYIHLGTFSVSSLGPAVYAKGTAAVGWAAARRRPWAKTTNTLRIPDMHKQSLILAATWLLLVFAMQLVPVGDGDVSWQLQLGRLTLERGELVTADPFSYTHAGDPMPPVGWLAQVVYALLHQLGSWQAVRLLHAVMFAGAFVLAGWSACRRPVSALSVLAGLALAVLVAQSNSNVRPQSFAAVGFVLLLMLAESRRPLWLRLVCLVPVLLVWQNTHPSIPVGGVAVLGLAAGKWGVWLRDRSGRKPWDVMAILLLLAVGQLATPSGWNVFAISRTNLIASRDWAGVTEWFHPWHPAVVHAMLPFWIVLGIATLLLARVGRSARAEDLGVLLAMTGLGLTAARFALFWSLALVPILIRWIEQARPADLFAPSPSPLVSRRQSAVVLSIGLLLAVVAGPILGRPSVDSPIPPDQMARLRRELPEGRIYNYRQWGGPLIREGYPQWQVAIDGRLYLFDQQDWLGYQSEAAGKTPLAEIVTRHAPDAFVLRPRDQQPLIDQLDDSPGWQRCGDDPQCAVFVRVKQ